MALEVDAKTNANYGETSAERMAPCNGYRVCDGQPRAGQVELKIPRLRAGSYFPSFLEPRRSVDKTLTAVIQDAYIHGIPTRLMGDLVQAIRGTGISKSHVSRFCEEIDEWVDAFLERPIEGASSASRLPLRWASTPTDAGKSWAWKSAHPRPSSAGPARGEAGDQRCPRRHQGRRIVGAILMEQAEEWTVQRGQYMTLETLAPSPR